MTEYDFLPDGKFKWFLMYQHGKIKNQFGYDPLNPTLKDKLHPDHDKIVEGIKSCQAVYTEARQEAHNTLDKHIRASEESQRITSEDMRRKMSSCFP
ncbi:hypothetical protein KW787_00010 [Candidatus Pacearchaeota archaeon]|nr:hypothetical protein [Candidatus Pacearchaeota archaeon]